MLQYCNAIWRCRYFWLSLVKVDLRSRYRGSLLGLGWSLLHPIAMTAIFTTVFCTLLGHDPRIYAVFVLSGLATWSFILNASVAGCECFRVAETYIRQHPAPIAIYPLRVVLGQGYHFLIALGMALVMNLLLLRSLTFIGVLSLPLSCALLLLFCWGLGTLCSLAYVYFRDVKQLLDVGFHALFYLTPVFYNARILPATLQSAQRFNPVLPFLDLIRKAVHEGTMPPPILYLKAGVIALTAVSLAVYALSRLEKRLIFHL